MTVVLELGRVVSQPVLYVVNIFNGAYDWCRIVRIMYHTEQVWQGDGILLCQSYGNATKHLQDMNIYIQYR